MKIETICVVGAGQMGAGIAQVAAAAGYKVILQDTEDRFVQRGMRGIQANLERAVAKAKIDEKRKNEILANITTTVDLSLAKQAEMVIEAIPEDQKLKKETFAKLDKICPKETIFASNTSSIPITGLASATARPEKVIGTHFINPVPVMKIVEVVRGYLTSDDTFLTTEEVLRKMGKEIARAKDFAGFATTRLSMPYMNEACYLLYEGVVTKEDLDKVMRQIMPMGPFEQIDFIGLDSVLSILRILYDAYGDHKYFPCPLLVQMVEAGRLGRKVGKGFYDYT